jgi:hypothetical protein
VRHIVLIFVLLVSHVVPRLSEAQTPSKPPGGRPFAGATVLPLRNGPNAFDLTGDRKPAIVFVGRRENFNAHGYSSIAFYVQAEGMWHVIPFFGGPANRDTTGTAEGADCILADVRVVRERRNAPVTVVLARRELGTSYGDAAPVHFHVYHLAANREGVPGRPLYYFNWARTIAAQQDYCDVNYAFAQELGLGDKGVAESEGGR